MNSFLHIDDTGAIDQVLYSTYSLGTSATRLIVPYLKAIGLLFLENFNYNMPKCAI